MKLGENVLKGIAKFDDAEKARQFVAACEKDFEGRLDEIAEKVAANKALHLVALSGPSCSGKTTTANKLISELEARGRRVHVVSIDDFYYDKDILNNMAAETGEIDYESIRSIDFEALVECVNEIFSDGITKVPRFDFKTGKRTGYVEYDPSDEDLFIFEGIQAIYPEITEVFSRYESLSVCICALSSIEIDGKHFEPNEIRLFRRLVRDYHFRNTTPEFTMKLWESVRANEEENIFPYMDSVDLIIDSTLAFEIGMLRPYLESILESFDPENKYARQIKDILQKVQGIEALPKSYITENSLYNEFI